MIFHLGRFRAYHKELYSTLVESLVDTSENNNQSISFAIEFKGLRNHISQRKLRFIQTKLIKIQELSFKTKFTIFYKSKESLQKSSVELEGYLVKKVKNNVDERI